MNRSSTVPLASIGTAPCKGDPIGGLFPFGRFFSPWHWSIHFFCNRTVGLDLWKSVRWWNLCFFGMRILSVSLRWRTLEMDRLELGAFTRHFDWFADGSRRADGFETEGAMVSWTTGIPCGSVLLWHSQLTCMTQRNPRESSWIIKKKNPKLKDIQTAWCSWIAMMHPWTHYSLLISTTEMAWKDLQWPSHFRPVQPSKVLSSVIPSNIHGKTSAYPISQPYPNHIPSISHPCGRGKIEATSRSSAVPTVCWSTIAGTCVRPGRRAEEFSYITPRRWRAFDSYVPWPWNRATRERCETGHGTVSCEKSWRNMNK